MLYRQYSAFGDIPCSDNKWWLSGEYLLRKPRTGDIVPDGPSEPWRLGIARAEPGLEPA